MIFDSEFSAAHFAALGIPDYVASEPSRSVQRLLLQAVSRLESAALRYPAIAPYAECVRKNLRIFVWCNSNKRKSPEFSSAAYPCLPGHVFITPMIFAHIPPNICFSGVSLYAPQENFIHEALHHNLARSLKLRPDLAAFMASRNQIPEIEIPWRSTHWSIEHALHAYYVYVHLAKVRSLYITNGLVTAEEASALLAAEPEVQKIITTIEEQLNSRFDASCFGKLALF